MEKRETQIILYIANSTPKKQHIELLFGVKNSGKENEGLPPGITAHCVIKEKDKPDIEMPYKAFLNQCIIYPIIVQIISTTDNRRLMFYRWNVMGDRNPIIPQVSPEGVPRYFSEYVWNEKEHNIADTKEAFILDGLEEIFFTIKPKENFEIHFNLLAEKTLVNFGTLMRNPFIS